MIDFNTIKVGDIVEVVGMGAPGFAKLGDRLEITRVFSNKVFAKTFGGSEAFFALTCGASRLSVLKNKDEH